jgi:hypothetical protein
MIERTVAALRARKHPVSTADRIAVQTQLQGLSAVRAHTVPLRNDVLDALSSALIKEALDAPPPWQRRGPIAAGTDARMVLMLQLFRGDARGRLADGTPQPGLVDDLRSRLTSLDLEPLPPPGRAVHLDLYDADDLARSRFLHAVRLLRLPGFDRTEGPKDPGSPERTERWRIVQQEQLLPAVLECAALGGTIPEAAHRQLLDGMQVAKDLRDLTPLLVDALFVGLDDLADQLFGHVKTAIGASRDLAAIGEATRLVVDLWRYDTLFVQQGHASLAELLDLLISAALWSWDRLQGGPADAGLQSAAAFLRVLLQHGPVTPEVRQLAMDVFRRTLTRASAPPDLRGASLGLLYACEGDQGDLPQRTARSLPPDRLGDWLAGLFAVTREIAADQPELLETVDDVLGNLALPAFLEALPALREAFRWFPPRERHALAAAIAGLHGGKSPFQLTHTDVSTEATAEGLALDAATADLLRTFALVPRD